MFADEETLILCGFEEFFADYEPVLLAGKSVYLFKKLKRGVKIC